jgi:hypothetical protein
MVFKHRRSPGAPREVLDESLEFVQGPLPIRDLQQK